MAAIIGITGGIGSGKSVVSRILRCFGHRVYDCDLQARLLMERSSELKDAVAAKFGKECINSDGSLHRARIAECVFGSPDDLAWLNGLVHGLVRDDLRRWAEECADTAVYVESAIMRTSHLDEMCDEIWLVTAPEEERLRRACERDRVDADKVLARMRAQTGEFENLHCASVHEIANDGRSSLLRQIDNLLKSK